jgi:hypothetical protein
MTSRRLAVKEYPWTALIVYETGNVEFITHNHETKEGAMQAVEEYADGLGKYDTIYVCECMRGYVECD